MKKMLSCVLGLVFLLFVGSVLEAAIPASERAALIALYNSTDGNNWTINSGWKTAPLHTDGFAKPGTENLWYGVTVSNNAVTKIDLHENNLSGTLPAAIGNFPNLEYLYLGLNSMNGAIQKTIANLTKLKELDLSSNFLTGGIPKELGNLSALQKLELNANYMDCTIPKELGNLNNLEHLGLAYSRLRGNIPTQLNKLIHLKTLDLAGNQLDGAIPPALGALTALESIYLRTNQLSGPIPTELGNLVHLLYLDLADNQLEGSIPAELGNLLSLQELLLFENKLTGEIPGELGKLSQLKKMHLYSNQLSGAIPAELGNLAGLQEFFVFANQLSGSIPDTVGNMSSLIHFQAQRNKLSGTIPAAFGRLENLYLLSLEENQLIGPVPKELMNAPSLLRVFLSYNCVHVTDDELEAWLNYRDLYWSTSQCTEKAAPFGDFQSPYGPVYTASGSIPLTGWALDDYGIDNVKLYCESENGWVYIADAVFVEGARPDVEAAYPDYPNNDRAGWGYLLLSNFLPNGGNGTYVFHALATDKSGKTTDLGSVTIPIDNANAKKPFGAIDKPTQGGVVSGTHYLNWGWALTPQPNKIPTNGATISVWVDGQPVGHPTYNNYRSDIATLFPGYANSNGAVGYFSLDTTGYSFGMHTISWEVKDNAGNTENIGSRYFEVRSTPPYGAAEKALTQASQKEKYQPDLQAMSLPSANVEGLPEEGSTTVRQCQEMGHLSIQVSQDHETLEGYMVVNNQLKPLPVGSTLQAKTGTFNWSLGPGFVGNYELVFVITYPDGYQYKKTVKVEVKPKFSRE